MRIKEGFKLRTVMGNAIVVAEGAKQVNFNKMISLNPSAEVLWRGIEGKDFTNETLAEILVAHYGIDYDTALKDSTEISAQWIKEGIVE